MDIQSFTGKTIHKKCLEHFNGGLRSSKHSTELHQLISDRNLKLLNTDSATKLEFTEAYSSQSICIHKESHHSPKSYADTKSTCVSSAEQMFTKCFKLASSCSKRYLIMILFNQQRKTNPSFQ